MSRLHNRLILIAAGSALICCLALWLSARRQLQAARAELLSTTDANEFLKKTLGEMTVAITAKERQIDRLQQSGCEAQEKTVPVVPAGPHPNRVKWN